VTIQTADPYAPDTDLRAERDKAAALAVATLLSESGPLDIRITVWRDYGDDTHVRALVADRALAADMADALGLREVECEGGYRWAGTVSGAPVQIVTH
jgi:hypothetical protein